MDRKVGYREASFEDWIKFALPNFLAAVVLIGGGYFLLKRGYMNFTVSIVWVVLIVLTFALIAVWQNRNYAFRCPNCGNTFTRFESLRILVNWAYNMRFFRCPNCHQVIWGQLLARVK